MHAVTPSSRNNVEFTAILIFSQQRVLPTIGCCRRKVHDEPGQRWLGDQGIIGTYMPNGAGTRTAQRDGLDPRREVAREVIILPESPSAVVCSRSFLLLVLSPFASLEETRIG